jgi:hypothetical protein
VSGLRTLRTREKPIWPCSFMAVLLVSDAAEDELAQDGQIVAQLEAGEHGHPAGRRFHVAARSGTGYLVTDVWESQEALDRFLQVLLRATEAAGSVRARHQVYPVHNIIDAA